MNVLTRLVSIALLVTTIFGPPFSLVAQEPKWFPPLVAASSANGAFLVVWEYQYTSPKAGVNPTVNKVTFHVFSKEGFPQDRFISPGTFWSRTAASWGVTLQAPDPAGVPWLPLVTNNGDYLVLVAGIPANNGEMGVMRIYRTHGQPDGVLIATHQLRDLWPPDQVALADVPHVVDGQPLWFAGGSFEFSPDNQQLIYKTRWGNTVRVNLANGEVSKEKE
jgi:hypothetical protein